MKISLSIEIKFKVISNFSPQLLISQLKLFDTFNAAGRQRS